MPKCIRTRNILGQRNSCTSNSVGHISKNIIDKSSDINKFAQDIINYAAVEITNNLLNTNNLQVIPLKPVELPLNIDIDIPDIVFNQTNTIFNEVTEQVTSIPSIPEIEIKLISNDFIQPYLQVGPYKLPPYSEFVRLITLIDSELNSIENKPKYKLNLYRGILDVLLRSRTMYFYDLQLQMQVETLRKKIYELENLVLKYSTQLASCQGSQNGYTLSGSVGIKLNKPKNLIYAQAILNINMAWYLYLYNTKTIEYDKYQGIIEFIKEKGKKEAYDELISLLDEKYKDIEDELDSSCDNTDSNSGNNSTNNSHQNSSCNNSSDSSSGNNSDNNSSNNSSDSSSHCDYTSSSSLSRTESFYSDNLNFCKLPYRGRALVIPGCLDILQPEKFRKLSSISEYHMHFKYKTSYKNKKNKKKSCKKSCKKKT